MPSTRSASTDELPYLIPPRYWQWLGSRRCHVILLWLVALGIGGQRLWHARQAFNNNPLDPPELQRADGNSGHAEIDFGGQWIMGRMFLEGHARELYHRERQWPIVRSAYPMEDGKPISLTDRIQVPHRRQFPTHLESNLRTDAEWMMYWFMGKDSPQWKTVGGAITAASAAWPSLPASLTMLVLTRDMVTPEVAAEVVKPRIGGPLYPPIHTFVMAPLAIGNDPRSSYHAAQVLVLALAYLAALGISMLSRGEIWWSVASIAVLLYPGTRGALDLAQNATLTLNIVLWGWVLAARGRTLAGGATWGLLAIKPTWAVAFLLVPLLMRRWRFLAGMCGVGALFVLATVPVVGIQTWRDWLTVGQEASKIYNTDENWIHLSRDLHGLPRRWMLDFNAPTEIRDNPTASIIGWSVWGTVMATTVITFTRRANRNAFVGVGPAFLFLGAYLTCFRFMYYDALLSLVAVAVLLASPSLFRRPTRLRLFTEVDDREAVAGMGYVNSFPLTMVVLLTLYENMLIASDLRSTFSFGFLARNAVSTPRLELDVPMHLAADTLLIVLLWAWCGIRLWCRPRDSHGL